MAVKFFGSRPAKMNWDLKHNEICGTLGVMLAYYDTKDLRIVSLLVSNNWSQKLLIKPLVPEQRSRLCICVRLYLNLPVSAFVSACVFGPLVYLYSVVCIYIRIVYNTCFFYELCSISSYFLSLMLIRFQIKYWIKITSLLCIAFVGLCIINRSLP